MGAWRFVCATVVLVAVALAGPGSAGAAEAGWPLDGPAETLLGFGERYTTEDGTYITHRGIDLVARPGDRVVAVLGGTVSFAGRIPAGEGATTLAATVQSGDLRITLMPLSELAVRAGDSVEPGRALGTLAATGDRSHGDSHVHVGARRGDLYVDPSAFLAPPLAASEPSDADVSVPAVANAPVVSRAPAPVPGAPAPAGATAQAAVTVGTGASAFDNVSSGARTPQAFPALEGAHSAQAAAGSAVTPEQAAVSATHADRVASGASAGHPAAAAVPAQLSGVVRTLELDEERVVATLVTDRRSEWLASGSPNFRAIVFGVASLAGCALLWPVWRSVPVPGLIVGAGRDDVAAVVSR